MGHPLYDEMINADHPTFTQNGHAPILGGMGEAPGSTLGGNDYHGSPSAAPAPQEAHSTSFNLGGPNETTVGKTVEGGIEAQHQAQAEQIADATTAKSDLADTKALRAAKAKEDVAKQQQNRTKTRH